MFIDREIREELNALSKEVFGVSGRWKKLLEFGTNELVTKTVTETIPGENGEPDKTEEVKVADTLRGANQYQHKTYTLDEVRELLLNLKKNRDEIRAKMKEMQEKRKLAEEVHKAAQGRVVG